jgi:DNA-binding MarR family transcriptional regulator
VSKPPDRPRGLLINTWIANELLAALLERNLTEDGARINFFATLSVIGVWGPLTPSEVAERTGTPLTTVSDRLRRMVENGDIERIAHPDDGRSHLVRVTPAGDARWRSGWPAIQRTIAQLEANLERPVEEIQDALVELIDAAQKASSQTSPVS